ncbi:MAG: aminotransferase class V-fold PLP-dependent enzyme [Planctomycetota bacterium]
MPPLYLDNAATSWPKPPGVLAAAANFVRLHGGNPGRAGHDFATHAAGLLDDLRRRAAEMFHAPGPDAVVFGLNGTDCLNMAIHGVIAARSGTDSPSAAGQRPSGSARARRPLHVVTSRFDHNSVQRMLASYAAAGGVTLTRVGRAGDGIWRAADVLRALRPETALVALTHASNVSGAVGDAAAVGAGLRARAASRSTRGKPSSPRSAPASAAPRPLFLLDAAQTAGALPIDMAALGADLVAMPGHKGLLGPTGTGLLLVGADAPPLAPWRMGGTGVDSTHPFQPDALPTRLEAGTANTFGLAGLRAALAYLERRGVAAIQYEEQRLRARLKKALSRLPGLRLVAADAEPAVGVISCDFGRRLAVSDAAAILNADFGIAVRSGLHCAPYAHELWDTVPAGTLRIALGPFNTTRDVDRVVKALAAILRAV